MHRLRLLAVFLLSVVVAGCGTSKPSSRPSAPRGGVFGGRRIDGYLVVPPGDADARPASN